MSDGTCIWSSMAGIVGHTVNPYNVGLSTLLQRPSGPSSYLSGTDRETNQFRFTGGFGFGFGSGGIWRVGFFGETERRTGLLACLLEIKSIEGHRKESGAGLASTPKEEAAMVARRVRMAEDGAKR